MRISPGLAAIAGHDPHVPKREPRLWTARCGDCLEPITATALELAARYDEHRLLCPRRER